MLRSAVSRIRPTATACHSWAPAAATITTTTARTTSAVSRRTVASTGTHQRLYTTKSNASPSLDAFRHQDTSFKSTASLNQSRYQKEIGELPQIKNRTPLYVVFGILGVGFWAGSLAIAANHQKQGTSVVKGTLFNVRYDDKAKELLGDNIDYRNPKWPWIYGTVAHLKGKVDIEYDVRGSKGEGRVHFQAYRPDKRWITTVFTLTTPDGVTVPLGEHTALPDLRDME